MLDAEDAFATTLHTVKTRVKEIRSTLVICDDDVARLLVHGGIAARRVRRIVRISAHLGNMMIIDNVIFHEGWSSSRQISNNLLLMSIYVFVTDKPVEWKYREGRVVAVDNKVENPAVFTVQQGIYSVSAHQPRGRFHKVVTQR